MSLILTNVPLSGQCRFEVGGPADYFAAVSGESELRAALQFAQQRGLRVFVYSGGSNLFFADAGFRGLVIRVVDGGWKVEERELVPSSYVNKERSSPRQNAAAPGGAGIPARQQIRQAKDDFARYNRRLPHWRISNATYFATWRLARDLADLTPKERDLTLEVMTKFDGQRYDLVGFVIMNDHVHVVVDPFEGVRLERLLGAWKGTSARLINTNRNRTGQLWQDESWDRIVRTEEELHEKLQYILNNPFKRWPDLTEYKWSYCALMDMEAGTNARPTGAITPVVKVSSGYDLPTLVRELAQQNLGGIEFLGNIPGSVGGAVVGNAGCYGRALAEVFVEADVFDTDEMRAFTAGSELFEFAYRHSALKFDPRYVVLSATLRLAPRPAAEVLAEVEGELGARLGKHPHFAACAGSFFKNPPGYPAWKVIADAGLTGASVGGARLHDKHANFLVSEGASAADVLGLARLVMTTVQGKLGLELEPEVRYVGEHGIEAI